MGWNVCKSHSMRLYPNLFLYLQVVTLVSPHNICVFTRIGQHSVKHAHNLKKVPLTSLYLVLLDTDYSKHITHTHTHFLPGHTDSPALTRDMQKADRHTEKKKKGKERECRRLK